MGLLALLRLVSPRSRLPSSSLASPLPLPLPPPVSQAYRTGLTDKLTFASTVWALLIATLVSPLVFRVVVTRAESDRGVGEKESGGGGAGTGEAVLTLTGDDETGL